MINERVHVEVEINGLPWRIVQMKDLSMRFYFKAGSKFMLHKNPPKSVLDLWTLIELDPLGGEQ